MFLMKLSYVLMHNAQWEKRRIAHRTEFFADWVLKWAIKIRQHTHTHTNRHIYPMAKNEMRRKCALQQMKILNYMIIVRAETCWSLSTDNSIKNFKLLTELNNANEKRIMLII